MEWLWAWIFFVYIFLNVVQYCVTVAQCHKTSVMKCYPSFLLFIYVGSRFFCEYSEQNFLFCIIDLWIIGFFDIFFFNFLTVDFSLKIVKTYNKQVNDFIFFVFFSIHWTFLPVHWIFFLTISINLIFNLIIYSMQLNRNLEYTL